MIETLRALVALQEVDEEVHAAEAELEALAGKRTSAAAARADEQRGVAAATAPFESAESRNAVLEAALAELEAKLTALEAQRYEVSSKQAFEGIARQIEEAQSRKSQEEDAILEQLDEIDTARAELDAVEERHREGEAVRDAEEKGLAAREQELEAELARLSTLRSERSTGIEEAALRRYEQIRKGLRPTLLLSTGESCPGCRVMLPPQKRNEIRRGDVLADCLGCRRILYGEKVIPA